MGDKDEYILTQGDKRYDFTLEMLDQDTLRAHCRDESDQYRGEYVGDYTFQELKDVNEVFYDFDNLDQAMAEMDESISKNLCGVIDCENHFEVVVYLDCNNKKAKVPLLLEWTGDCRFRGAHNPDKIQSMERDLENIRNEQAQLKRDMENALGGQTYQTNQAYRGDERKIPEDEVEKYERMRNSYRY